jgi:hypothetical protein
MVDALGRVRRRTSGTRLWTCCAGRAGTRIRSEALHQRLTIGHPAADRAGARPFAQSNRQTQGPLRRNALDTTAQRLQSKLVQPTVVLDRSVARAYQGRALPTCNILSTRFTLSPGFIDPTALASRRIAIVTAWPSSLAKGVELGLVNGFTNSRSRGATSLPFRRTLQPSLHSSPRAPQRWWNRAHIHVRLR